MFSIIDPVSKFLYLGQRSEGVVAYWSFSFHPSMSASSILKLSWLDRWRCFIIKGQSIKLDNGTQNYWFVDMHVRFKWKNNIVSLVIVSVGVFFGGFFCLLNIHLWSMDIAVFLLWAEKQEERQVEKARKWEQTGSEGSMLTGSQCSRILARQEDEFGELLCFCIKF